MGSSNSRDVAAVMGPAVNAAGLGNGQGCDAFTADLTGLVPIIERGTCAFSTKLANAAAAGAPAAIVYNEASPASGAADDTVIMGVSDNPTIPGLFVGRPDGLKLLAALLANEDYQLALSFPATRPSTVSYFSSLGPSVDLRIKPDLVATGSPLYTATIAAPADTCAMCDPSGYITTQGTSFAAPLVAGSAAVLRAARPGLELDAYRSLLVNSAAALVNSGSGTAPVNSAGAGVLDLENALRSTLVAAPVSASFGSGGSTLDAMRELQFRNLGTTDATFQLRVESAAASKPVLSADQLSLAAGGTATLQLVWQAKDLPAGSYGGFVVAREASTGIESRIPYWYGVEGSAAAATTTIGADPAKPLAGQIFAVLFRVHDTAGLALATEPVIAPLSGGATVISLESVTDAYPNAWRLTALAGADAGWNIFNVRVGEVTLTLPVRTY
jgi:hypothetical protein